MVAILAALLVPSDRFAAVNPGPDPLTRLRRLGIDYSFSFETSPRPLRWHHLAVDLRNPRIKVKVAVGPDPDGEGPAESRLASPLSLAQSVDSLAMVNANAFMALQGQRRAYGGMWVLDQPVKIGGLAVVDGAVRSRPEKRRASFWIDRTGTPKLAETLETPGAREGAAGFGQILRGGRVLPARSNTRHPRTAVGMNATGDILHLIVVDGRRKGVSEGVSTHELATRMLELGCSDAINLDGGGSSIMVLAQEGGFQHIVNSPSDRILGQSIPRPIPVALCITENASPHPSR